ncbi:MULTISPECIES: 2-hydroxyacid dehydrogenase [Thalassobaculum]|uniref:Glyoxylate/hydroxypyruvate reductase A n=1 Tax=Thalassobaculum litoreum DSM 18839 TaxID=1123362 RepID=A0A8G2BGG6_9PROT|nr:MULTISPECIES: glyoxylate/hydroxypyruvate reductase A [Thalassobaculum]SDF55161.1 glyoxylate/hydroxypyruvate reductase A [Thalassobaculum litoreum DSM 18839]
MTAIVNPIVAVHSTGDGPSAWIAALKDEMPGVDARPALDIAGDDLARVDVSISWRLPHGVMARFSNLKLAQSIGAGVDHILEDPERPLHVPIARLIDPFMAGSMTHHIVLQILRWHRKADKFERFAAEHVWPMSEAFDHRKLHVAILGLGTLGEHLSRSLTALEIANTGWTRSPRSAAGVASVSGAAELDALLARSNVVVCLLPLTEQTEGVLCAELFAKLPKGALLVNVGRGGHLVEEDLIPALDSGQLSAAALDVFRQEPLPADHPFWSDARIYITPHIAAEVNPPTASIAFAKNIALIRAGETPTGLVDLDRGY